MILDTDTHFLSQARDHLEERGHLVVHETTPSRAATRCHHWKPEVILVDSELEAVHGGDLLAALGGQAHRPAIVLVSTLQRFDLAWRAWQRGGDDLLFKPMLHPSELDSSVRTALANSVTQRRWQPMSMSA
jgi:PleD family two-component response regulator